MFKFDLINFMLQVVKHDGYKRGSTTREDGFVFFIHSPLCHHCTLYIVLCAVMCNIGSFIKHFVSSNLSKKKYVCCRVVIKAY